MILINNYFFNIYITVTKHIEITMLLEGKELEKRMLDLEGSKHTYLLGIKAGWRIDFPNIREHELNSFENQIRNFKHDPEKDLSEGCYPHSVGLFCTKMREVFKRKNQINKWILSLHEHAKGEDVHEYANYIKNSESDMMVLNDIINWMHDEIHLSNHDSNYKMRDLECCPFINKE